VGRLADHHKNLVFLIRGLARLKDRPWKLKVIGTGEDEVKLKSLSKKLGLSDRIEWLGFQKNPYQDLHEVTALLLTSRCEGLPTVLLEANQRGIPAISSDCRSGPKDVIIPGKNGYLYKEGDMEEFIGVLEKVIGGEWGFDSPQNIAKTTEKFDHLSVVSKIFNFLRKQVQGQE
jgi:UDP-D-galactose:(glucosyl)LPS alpha-1,6-D-galactosyltransferase